MKKKLTDEKSGVKRTGGGSSQIIVLSETEYELADILGTRAISCTSKYDDDEGLYDQLPENYFKMFLVGNNGYSLSQNTLSMLIWKN